MRSRFSHWFKYFGLPTLILFMISLLVFNGELWTLVLFYTFGIGLILFVAPYLFVGALGAAFCSLMIDTRRSSRNLLLCYIIGPGVSFLGLPWIAHTFVVPSQTLPAESQQPLQTGIDISDLTINFVANLNGDEIKDHLRALVESGKIERLMVTYEGRTDNFQYYEVKPNTSCGNNRKWSCLEPKEFYLSNSYVLDVSGARRQKANILFRGLSPVSDYISVSLRAPHGTVLGRATAQIQRPLTLPTSFRHANNGSSYSLPDMILGRDDIQDDPSDLLTGLNHFLTASSSGLRSAKIPPPTSELISVEDFESEIIRQRFAQAESQTAKSAPVKPRPQIVTISRNYQGFIYTARRRDWPQKDVDLLVSILSEPGQDCDVVNDHLYPAAMIEEPSGAVVRATLKCVGQRQNAKLYSMSKFNEGLSELPPNALAPYMADIVSFFETSDAQDLTSLWPWLMQSNEDLSRVWKRQLALDNPSTFTTMHALDQICDAPAWLQKTALAALHARLSGFGDPTQPRVRGTSMSARIISILDGFGEADAYLNNLRGREVREVHEFTAQMQAAGSACPPWGNPPY